MTTKASRPEFEFVDQIHDPIWGGIPITDLEKRLLADDRLSRLGQIRQLGLAFFDYTGLTHSRLEHSIGVMHVADRMYSTLRDTVWHTAHRKVPFKRVFGSDRPGTKQEQKTRQAVRLAALLHDLGHPPYSHAVELTFRRYPSLLRTALRSLQARSDNASQSGGRKDRGGRAAEGLFDAHAYSHEGFTRWVIEQSDLLQPATQLLGKALADEIPTLAIGKASGALAPFNSIISGDFDADRIDYLIRDNRYSGFVVGLSVDELFDAIHLRRERGRGGDYSLYIDERALPFVNAVLAARERLIRRVHLARSGRTATQMLINALYYVLREDGGMRPTSQEHSAADLAARGHIPLDQTIQWLHEKCTDSTFFHELLKRQGVPSTEIGRYFIDRFVRVAKHPRAAETWRQRGHLNFMKMHPCLRSLAYLAATSQYESPEDLLFWDPVTKQNVFLEPSARPSQGSSLLVDFTARTSSDAASSTTPLSPHPTKENRDDPNLEYFGATENLQGRAILQESLSLIDVYAYDMDGSGTDAGWAGERRCKALSIEDKHLNDFVEAPGDSKDVVFGVALNREEKKIAFAVSTVARRLRQQRSSASGLFPSDFLLTLLYLLDKVTRRHSPDARSVYVYRNEYFLNRFLPALVEAPGFPLELKGGDLALKAFVHLQRLIVCGLVETRRQSVLNPQRFQGTRATRRNVYSTRDDFRISLWGKHFVESEIGPADYADLEFLVDQRQRKHTRALEALARQFWKMNSVDGHGKDRLDAMREFENDIEREAMAIGKKAGCTLVFSLKPDGRRVRAARSARF